MAYTPTTGSRDFLAALRRVMEKAWWGKDNGAAQAPLALNNESILALNAAGTGTVPLIGADGNNNVYVPDNSGQVRFLANGASKTIVDGSATSLFDVACAAGARASGVVLYNVFASDGTDYQSMTGMATYSAVNKAGTLTLAVGYATGNDAKAVSSGTLTLSFTFVTGTNKGTFKLTPTGSLTETTYFIFYTVLPLAGTITIL